MKKTIASLIVFSCMFVTSIFGDTIKWLNDYDQALNESKSSSKPVLLLVTGGDLCVFCVNLENEVLKTSEFANALGKQFIFVKIDYPIPEDLSPKLAEQHEELIDKFHVKGLPAVILIDSQQNKIGSLDYRPGGARPYIESLQKMLQDHHVEQLNSNKP